MREKQGQCKDFFFFFQAEDGIRDYKVTGVQTCALPISLAPLAGNPNDVLAWPAEALPAQQALWQILPARLSGWVAALGASPVVRVVGDAGQDGGEDLGQPLVLAGAEIGRAHA